MSHELPEWAKDEKVSRHLEPEVLELAVKAIMLAMEDANVTLVEFAWSDPTILVDVVAHEFLLNALRAVFPPPRA